MNIHTAVFAKEVLFPNPLVSASAVRRVSMGMLEDTVLIFAYEKFARMLYDEERLASAKARILSRVQLQPTKA